MMDFARQNDFATIGAAFTRMYANAAMRTLVATASHGLLLWSGFLAASVPKASVADWHSPTAIIEQAMRLTPYGWMAVPGAAPKLAGMWNASEIASGIATLPEPVAQPPFASYRSAGGHASAQVIVLPMPTKA